MSIIANFKFNFCQLLLSNSQAADLEELLRLKDPWLLGFEECSLGEKKRRIVLIRSRRHDNKMWGKCVNSDTEQILSN